MIIIGSARKALAVSYILIQMDRIDWQKQLNAKNHTHNKSVLAELGNILKARNKWLIRTLCSYSLKPMDLHAPVTGLLSGQTNKPLVPSNSWLSGTPIASFKILS